MPFLRLRTRGRRDLARLEELYDRHGAAAYRCALALVGDATAAEAAVEAAFLEVWRSGADKASTDGSLLPAVYRACCTRRSCTLIDGLPAEPRDALLLTRFGGMTAAETARVLGTTTPQVHRMLLQGLRTVQARLAGADSGDGLGATERIAARDSIADSLEPGPALELERQPRRPPESRANGAVGDREAARDAAVV